VLDMGHLNASKIEHTEDGLVFLLDDMLSKLPHLNPRDMASRIAESFRNEGYDISCVYVKGTIANRVILFSILDLWYIYSAARTLHELREVYPELNKIEITTLSSRMSKCYLKQSQIELLSEPSIRLIVLCHKENFPLPRFALGVADLAASVRRGLWGQVTISDMQLDTCLIALIESLRNEKPDIIGISITFGQNDILEELLKGLTTITNYNPIVVVGGSLAFLNQKYLLNKHENILVSTGYGEQTILSLVKYFNREIPKEQIAGILYKDVTGQIVKSDNALSNDNGIPELDNLDEILVARGVMLLETSRGCVNDCAFCPRSHKGKWKSLDLPSLTSLIPKISQIYDNHPNISKKIFFVDEEFIGSATNSELSNKIDSVCKPLSQYGFKYEISSRITQVYDNSRDDEWHRERLKLWKKMKRYGLNRSLFGVESGVDSILKRFNKNVSSYENTLALRILSSLDIPFRITYITFDPLMNMQELIESYLYQGRTDVILEHNTLFDVENFHILGGEDYAISNSKNIPLYSNISYMLVSLECLMNTPYSQSIVEKNLVVSKNMQMGKYVASYIDERIGLMSHHSQLWIDRNFSLDYLLKSLLKTKDKSMSLSLERVRNIIKRHSYVLLGKFLVCATKNIDIISMPDDSATHLKSLYERLSLETSLQIILEKQREDLSTEIHDSLNNVSACLHTWEMELLKTEVEKWSSGSTWRLING
jgi:radical SAM superfamily enzyme YgiQ (UPF0313 family)